LAQAILVQEAFPSQAFAALLEERLQRIQLTRNMATTAQDFPVRTLCMSNLPSVHLSQGSSIDPNLLASGIFSRSKHSMSPKRNAAKSHQVTDPHDAVCSMPGILGVHDLLGVGSFGYVYRCTFEGVTEQVAVKVLFQNMLSLEQNREVTLLQELHHPNLVRLLEVVHGSLQGLVLELCAGGSLQELLHGPNAQCLLMGLGLQQRVKAALDVASAVEYLHSAGIVHRDVKSGNAFLSQPVAPGAVALPLVKLGDLGLARFVAPTAAMMTQGVGTVRYMAPEVIVSSLYGLAADIFSCGILLHELVTGMLPYGGGKKMNDGVLTMAIMGGQRPPIDAIPGGDIGTCLKLLLEECWAGDPDRRLSASDLVCRLRLAMGSGNGNYHLN